MTVVEAQRALENALTAARARGDPEAIRLHQQLIDVLLEQAEFNRARELADKEVESARLSGETARLGLALTAAGDTRFSVSDFDGALRCFEEAEKILAKGSSLGDLSVVRRSIGVVLRYQGRLEESATWLEAAALDARAYGQASTLASTLENLAWTWMALGDQARAGRLFEEAAAAAGRSGVDRSRAHALLRVGIFRMDSETPELALPLFDETLEIARRLGLSELENWALTVRARTLALVGRRDEAIAIERDLLARPVSPDYGGVIVGRLADMGGLLLGQDPVAALDYLERARTIAEREGWPVPWPLHVNAARALRALGRRDEAADRYEAALAEIESLRSRLAAETHRVSFFERNRDVYEELALVQFERHLAGAPEAAELAFHLLERAKARSLLESIEDAGPAESTPLDGDLLVRRREIEGRIAGMQKRLAGGGTTAPQRQSLLLGLEGAEADWTRWLTEVRQRDPRFAALNHPEPLGVDGARALLDDRTALVAWLETAEGPLAFVLTTTTFEILHLEIARRELRERVEGYLDLLGRDDDAWRTVSRRLYRELVEPETRRLPAGVANLILVPDGVLNFLPFETLLIPARGEAGERFLVEDYSIAYAPSASALSVLRRFTNSPGHLTAPAAVFVVANPDPASAPGAPGKTGSGTATRRALFEGEGLTISPIPRSVAEARTVLAFGGAGSEMHVGSDASEALVKQALLSRFGVLHFATHGLVSVEQPSRSALWLAAGAGDEDGFLQVREIRELHLASDLVVLSACRTGGGRVLAGEGVEGLARAFLEAGASAVVASLWDVDDEGTAEFMRSLYGHLARGLTKSDALREAKLDLIRQNPDASPRTWAAFVLIGAGDSAVALRTPGSGATALLAVLALVAVGAIAVLAAGRMSRRASYRM